MINKKYTFLKEAISVLQPNAEEGVPKILGITLEKLLEIISQGMYSLNRDYKLSSDITNKLIQYLIPSKSIKGIKLCTNIAQAVGFKWCTLCLEYKPVEEFNYNASRSLGLNAYCSKCQVITVSKTQAPRQARYKANKLNRTPKWLTWEDHQDISKFYANCPLGYHVDHVIPLQGDKVSGLHCLNNLQYLLASENISKHNSFDI